MEHYFVFTATVIMCVLGCHGQYVSDLTVEGLQTRVRQLEETVSSLLAKLEGGRASQTALTNIPLQTAEKRGLQSLPYNNINGITLQRFATGDEVGFSVLLGQNADLTYGMKIKFDTVVENLGNAYNKQTGEFTCPIAGTYLFSLDIVCSKGSYIEASVEVNNGSPRYILNTICDHRKRTAADGYPFYCGETQNGGTAIVQLKVGDRVSVKKVWPVIDVSTIVGKDLSSFSGYLLRPS